METAKRKHKLYDHPFLGGLVALIIAHLFISNFTVFPMLCADIAKDMLGGAEVPAEMAAAFQNVGDILTILAAFFCLLVHRLWFRKDGYKGCFNRSGFRNKEAWLFVLGGVVLDVVVTASSYAVKGTVPVIPTVTTLLIAFRAGAFEETVFRGIPVAIMMKNKPSRKRMWAVVIVTAAVFGLVHMGNIGAGAALSGAIVQSVNAFCLGLFLVAIYLRTGNIMLTMVSHALHDVVALTDPEQVTGVFTTSSFSASELMILAAIAAAYAAAGIYMLRKSKWEEIQTTWANIWAE